MKVGLFFGSFNPVHNGHMLVANYMVTHGNLDELWFVISPQNPLKKKRLLADDHLRLEMLQIAVRSNPRIKVSDVELGLTKPSYTINTLNYLRESYPDYKFIIIMGVDGLAGFSKWKNHKYIEENYERYIYPRRGYELFDLNTCKNCTFQPAEEIDISSTEIRKAISERKDVRNFLPEGVYEYIISKKLYF